MALQLAKTTEPNEAHKKITWRLAHAVLNANQEYAWQLLENPARLRILTIDSLCAKICNQMPLLSKLGAQTKITEQAYPLYQQASTNLLHSTLLTDQHNVAIKTLLIHLDNRSEQLIYLCSAMLAKRSQWLRYIIRYSQQALSLKDLLEQGLQHIAIEAMQHTKHLLSNELDSEVLDLFNFSRQNLTPEISAIKQLPDTVTEQIETWKVIANLFLTKTGSIRKSIDKRSGFPAASNVSDLIIKNQRQTYKARWKDLQTKLEDNSSLISALQQIQNCPPLYYTEIQWNIIEALLSLLPRLVAELQLVFQQQHCIDFNELNIAAQRGLGEPDDPTDLALQLDYQIQHLLIDEFQDTSVSQFELIEQLITGWEPDDGRTVFIVGDPMQSIYRFRQAEVGLFLRAEQQGISDIPLKSLRLSLNFRSNQSLVEWSNVLFNEVFPSQADHHTGAVNFTPAATTRNAEAKIHYYANTDHTLIEEAKQIAKIIKTSKTQCADTSIAILIRSRWQLTEIIPALQAASINYQAVDIDTLAHCPAVQDLKTLTYALLHRADNLHWLALLRGPYGGIELKDLETIANADRKNTLWQSLQNYLKLSLSNTANLRLKKLVPTLQVIFNEQGQLSIRDWLQRAWLALGGKLIADQAEINNCLAYFDLIDELDQNNQLNELATLEQQLQKLFVKYANKEANPVQIMTIHKAKGLEFDQVILPNLNKRTSQDPSQLLLWLERPSEFGTNDLILAPIKSAATKQDSIYDYLRQLEKTKLEYETARLLYVAVTRAKSSLHLLTQITIDDDAILEPKKGSFLSLLWPHCQNEFMAKLKICDSNETDTTITEINPLKRLKTDWQLLNANNEPVEYQGMVTSSPQSLENIMNTNYRSSYIGTIIHETLAQIAIDGIQNWSAAKCQSEPQQKHWQIRLQQLNMPTADLIESLNTITQAIQNTLQDPRGQWILHPHTAHTAEFEITAIIDNKVKHLIIDRSFIDENGVRWIIDYKSASPQPGQAIDDFIHSQTSKYRSQLADYAKALSQLENRPCQCALYFPYCGLFHAWKYNTMVANV